MSGFRLKASVFFTLGLIVGVARAGPPFLTDDPEPVDYQHWEFYMFGSGDRTVSGDAISGPAVELNYGVVPDVQLHLIAPLNNVSAPGVGWSSGYGDTELGVKLRLLKEGGYLPEVGIFPMAEVDTGDAGRGLGAGRTWYRLPLWLQKTWGPWTTYGGGGFELNHAAGQHNSGFLGWLVQRDVGKYLTLGSELYRETPGQQGARGSDIVNIGGYLKLSESFNVLFSGGRSISGDRQTVWYLGLYWTWGPAEQPK